MECSRVHELLSAYLDDDLDRPTRGYLDEHLTLCMQCRTELEALQIVLRELRNLPKIAAPPDFLAQVRQRVESPSGWRQIIRRLLFPWQIKIPLELAGVTAAVLLCVFAYHGLKTGKEMSYTSPPGSLPTIVESRPVSPGLKEKPDVTQDLVAGTTKSRREHRADKTPTLELALVIKDKSESEKAELSPTRPGRPLPKTLAAAPSPRETEYGLTPPSPSKMPMTGSGSRAAAKKSAPPAHGPESTSAGKNGLEEDWSGVGKDEAERLAKQFPEISKFSPKLAKPGPGDPVSQVKDILKIVNGTLVAVQYRPGTKIPQSLTIDLPAPQLPTFLEKLSLIGELSPPPPNLTPENSRETVHLQLELVLPQQ